MAISFQTRTELIQGAKAREWGEQRFLKLRHILDSTPTVYPDPDVVETHAELYAQCRLTGHALHDKIHTGDRWVASCAIAKSFPLLSGDNLYEDAPLLSLLTTEP